MYYDCYPMAMFKVADKWLASAKMQKIRYNIRKFITLESHKLSTGGWKYIDLDIFYKSYIECHQEEGLVYLTNSNSILQSWQEFSSLSYIHSIWQTPYANPTWQQQQFLYSVFAFPWNTTEQTHKKCCLVVYFTLYDC